MQYQNREEDRRDESLIKNIEQRLELSAAWRALLGLDQTAPVTLAAGSTVAADVPVLKNDPWVALLRTRDIQVIDLQQLHSFPALDERDVELALDNIQEQQL
jgi:hypothetical protein